MHSLNSRFSAICVWLTLQIALGLDAAAQSPPPLLEVQVPTGRFTGLPIHWGARSAILLEPAGGFRSLDVGEVREHRILEEPFLPLSLANARASLQGEFGNSFETAVTGPYVIVAPRGEANRWRDRFRTLLAGYSRYFEVRGWQLRQSDFPLVVIILPDRATFRSYAIGEVGNRIDSILGYYSPQSNRCVMYKIDGSGGTDWSETEETIVHEAIHQLAFNTGVHERLAENPVWVVEGFATMFERSSVYDGPSTNSSLSKRVNRNHISRLRSLLADAKSFEQQLATVIVSDEMFKSNAVDAYAIAWGLVFYLAERAPREFGAFTQQLAQLPPMQPYQAEQRARDFQQGFAFELPILVTKMQRFYAE